MLIAIASPTAPVVCKLQESQPRRGGMLGNVSALLSVEVVGRMRSHQENAPDAATMRQP